MRRQGRASRWQYPSKDHVRTKGQVPEEKRPSSESPRFHLCSSAESPPLGGDSRVPAPDPGQQAFSLFLPREKQRNISVVFSGSPAAAQEQVLFPVCIPGASTAFKNHWESERGTLQAKRRHVLQVLGPGRNELKLNEWKLDVRSNLKQLLKATFPQHIRGASSLLKGKLGCFTRGEVPGWGSAGLKAEPRQRE